MSQAMFSRLPPSALRLPPSVTLCPVGVLLRRRALLPRSCPSLSLPGRGVVYDWSRRGARASCPHRAADTAALRWRRVTPYAQDCSHGNRAGAGRRGDRPEHGAVSDGLADGRAAVAVFAGGGNGTSGRYVACGPGLHRRPASDRDRRLAGIAHPPASRSRRPTMTLPVSSSAIAIEVLVERRPDVLDDAGTFYIHEGRWSCRR